MVKKNTISQNIATKKTSVIGLQILPLLPLFLQFRLSCPTLLQTVHLRNLRVVLCRGSFLPKWNNRTGLFAEIASFVTGSNSVTFMPSVVVVSFRGVQLWLIIFSIDSSSLVLITAIPNKKLKYLREK